MVTTQMGPDEWRDYDEDNVPNYLNDRFLRSLNEINRKFYGFKYLGLTC